MRVIFALLVATVVFALFSGVASQEVPLGDWTLSLGDFSLTSRSIKTHVTIEVDNTVAAPTLSVVAVGPFPVSKVTRGLISQSGNNIEVLDWNTQTEETSGAANVHPSVLAVSLPLAIVAGLFLAPGKRVSASSSLATIIIIAVIALSTTWAAEEGPYVQIRLRLPTSATLGSVSFDLASGSLVTAPSSSFTANSLSVNMCRADQPTIATLDAVVVGSSADLCTNGALAFTNFYQGGSSVSVNLHSRNQSVVASSPRFTGSYSLTGASGVTISGNDSCSVSSTNPTSTSGKCLESSTHSLIAIAATTAKFEIFPGCPAGFTDGPMNDFVPPSPAVNPATSATWDINTESNWRGWSDWGKLVSGASPRGYGVNFTVPAWMNPYSSWLESRKPLVVTAGLGNTLKFGFSFDNQPAIANITVVLVDFTIFEGREPYWWTIDSKIFGPDDPAVLDTKVVFGPLTNPMQATSVVLTPSRSVGNARLLFKINWNTHYGQKWTLISDSITWQQTIATPTAFSGASELVQDAVMPATFDPNPRTQSDCPHLATGLLNWHDESIWPNGVMPNPGQSISIPEGKSVLISSCSLLPNFVYYRIHVPSTSRLIFADANINLRVRNMWVEGQLHIGSPTCRLNGKVTIEFVGDKTLDDLIAPDYGSKGLGVSGTVDIHGKQYNPTWTRLSASIYPGADTLYLRSNTNWEVGQTIVVATSVYNDTKSDENEVRVIKAIDTNGRRIQVDKHFEFYHHGGSEYQSEVGLLSRRIVLKGDDASETNEFGGHTRVMGEGRFSGVQTYRMGQKNMLGKYPFHFHMMGPSPKSFVKDCSIWNSYFRCIAIHATNDTHALRNVAFNATAHCYYLEDGVEENNVVSYNLAVRVNVIGRPMGGESQIGQIRVESPDLILPADAAAGGFYITNAYNTFIGNAASGGWAGYSFPNLPGPIGLSRHVKMVPEERPSYIFLGNTAHSSGYMFPGGGCIYVGGQLKFDPNNPTKLWYDNGRYSRNTKNPNGMSAWMQFNDTKTWMCNMGVSHWGDRVDIANYESYDSGRSVQIFGDSSFVNAIVTAESKSMYKFPEAKLGFGFYDTWVRSIVTDIKFRGFTASTPAYDPSSDRIPYYWPDKRVLGALIHSDYFKPQGISATARLTFENCDRTQYIAHKTLDTGSARYYNFVDWDGSVGGTPGVPQVIASARGWWLYDSACVIEPGWWAYRCPLGNRAIANIHYIIPGVMNSRDGGTGMDQYIGQTFLFGPGIPAGRNATLTKNPGVTGISKIGWYFHQDQGTPQTFSAAPLVMPTGQWVIGAWKYPAGTTFTIQATFRWGQQPVSVTQVNTMSELVNGDGAKYFFDGQHLYIKFVKLLPAEAALGFTRAGVTIWNINQNQAYSVTATCPGLSGSWCPAPLVHPTQTW